MCLRWKAQTNSGRAIDKIIWHCSATREGHDIKIDDIREWHVQTNGWSDIGYHFVVELDGAVRIGRPIERPGAHVRGHNRNSVGICYVGGLDNNKRPTDTRTKKQKAALYELTKALIANYPHATVHGHNEFANKACPCFDASTDWLGHFDQEMTENQFTEEERGKMPDLNEA